MKRYSYHLQLLALAWAGVLLVGATACGDGDDPNETPEPPATQPVPAQTSIFLLYAL